MKVNKIPKDVLYNVRNRIADSSNDTSFDDKIEKMSLKKLVCYSAGSEIGETEEIIDEYEKLKKIEEQEKEREEFEKRFTTKCKGNPSICDCELCRKIKGEF